MNRTCSVAPLRFFPAVSVALLLIMTALCPLAAAQGASGTAPSDSVADPTVVSRSDSVLERRLEAIYAQVEALRGVQAAVNSGVVRLTGTVVQPRDAVRAEEIASRLDGTVYVINDLETETDVGSRVTPVVENVREGLQAVVDRLPSAAVALLVVLLFGGASRFLGRWETPPKRLSVSPLVWQLIRRLFQGGVALVGLILAFDILGIASLVGAVLGTAGVAGLAIGFAFQDIIENYLAGALLSIQQPFNVNDVVEIADQEGRVVRLTARELVLLTFEGNHVRVPNATVFKNVTTNYSRNPRRLFSFDLGVGTGEDLTVVTRIGVETLQSMNGVLDDPGPFARVREVGDSSVLLRFHGWVNQQEADIFKVRSEAVRLVKTALEEAEVDMPEPTYRLLLWQQDTAITAGTASSSTERAAEQGRLVDVAPDGKLEAQVEADLARSDEQNFLAEDDEVGAE